MEVVENGLAPLPPVVAAPLLAVDPPLVAGRPAALVTVNVATVVTVNVIAAATARRVHQLTVLPIMTADVVQDRVLPLVQTAAAATTMERTATKVRVVEAVQESGMMIRLRAPALVDDGTWDLVLRPLNDVLRRMMETVLDRLRLVRGRSPPERALSLLRFVLPLLYMGSLRIGVIYVDGDNNKKGLSVHTV